jgi:predicted nuclease of restriction endonuclease-like (RecB) superfamily
VIYTQKLKDVSKTNYCVINTFHTIWKKNEIAVQIKTNVPSLQYKVFLVHAVVEKAPHTLEFVLVVA